MNILRADWLGSLNPSVEQEVALAAEDLGLGRLADGAVADEAPPPLGLGFPRALGADEGGVVSAGQHPLVVDHSEQLILLSLIHISEPTRPRLI
eukprot:2426985-Rhodomonas_salina.2